MLTPMFTQGEPEKELDGFIAERLNKVAEGLAYFGQQFVNAARGGGIGRNYIDRTGNLRASIGYVVVRNQKRLKGDMTGGDNPRPEGIEKAEKTAKQVISDENPASIVLIGTAGMQYAASVESKGYSVITPYAPNESEVKSFMKEAGLTD